MIFMYNSQLSERCMVKIISSVFFLFWTSPEVLFPALSAGLIYKVPLLLLLSGNLS